MFRSATRERYVLVAVLLISLVYVVDVVRSTLDGGGGDPLVFAALGAEEQTFREIVTDRIGREGPLRNGLGHDGKVFLVQSWDPFFLDTEPFAQADDPVYRGRRVGYPMFLGLGGLLPSGWTPWAMVVSQVVVILFGTWATARLAQSYGASPLAGLAFAFSPGVYYCLLIGGADTAAFAWAIAGTLAVRRDRPTVAAGCFALAVLTKEVLALYVAAVFVARWVTTSGSWRTRVPWRIAVVPATVLLAWDAYLRWRFPTTSVASKYSLIEVPFSGAVGAASGWTDDGDWLLVTQLALVSLMFVVLGVRRWREPLVMAGLCFVALAPLLGEVVWKEPFDIVRGVNVIYPLLGVLGAVYWRERRALSATVGS